MTAARYAIIVAILPNLTGQELEDLRAAIDRQQELRREPPPEARSRRTLEPWEEDPHGPPRA